MEKCPVCSLAFSRREELDAHILRNHKKQTNPSIQYQCQGCLQIWSNYSTLYKHRRTCLGMHDATATGPSHLDVDMDVLCHSSSDGGNASNAANASGDEAMDVDFDADSSGTNDCETSSSEELYSETILTAEEQLQEGVIDFLMHLKEDCNATQTVTDEVVVGVNKLNQKLLDVVEKVLIQKAGASEVLSIDEVSVIFQDLQQMSIFDGIGHKENLLEYLVQNEGLVLPEKVPFEEPKQAIKNKKLIQQDGDIFYQVDFLSQLERTLNNEDVMACLENPRESKPFIFNGILDGILYRHHSLVLKLKNKPVLCIIFYHDSVEVVDSTSPRRGKHTMTFFYWLLANIFPELRCTDNVINLYAIAKTSDVKKYKYSKIMENFKQGINALSSEEGVDFIINGKKINFHGELHAVEGDYPAQGAFGGYKESVSADSPCRECLASSEEEYIKVTDISQFELRNKETHNQHVAEVLEYEKLSTKEKARRPFNPSVKYGVNGKSILLDFKYFDVTKMLPEDIMHCAHEGVVELTCRLVLRHVVDQGMMSMDEINRRISLFAANFPVDRPGEIAEEHLASDKKLRQSAAQMRVLLIVLPFALQIKDEVGDKWIFAGERRYLDCLLSLIKVMQLAMAYEYHIDDVDVLRKRIEDFHRRLLEIYPELNMAKIHFLHHLSDLIVLYGSIRQVATFRMEGHHAIFKHLLKIMHNYVNPMLSIATRHQTRQCRQMMKGKFLYGGHKFTAVRDVSNLVDRNINTLKELFPNHETITELSRLSMHGTVYKINTLVLLSNSEPNFAALRKIYMVDGKFLFIGQKMITIGINENVNAFELKPTASSCVIDAESLAYPHEIINIRWLGKSFAVPLSHRIFLV